MAKMCLSVSMLSQKLRQRLHDALVDTGRNMMLAREQGIYWRIFALSLGVRCCKYLSLYVLLLALVLPLGFTVQSFPLPKVFLGLCSAELAASLPISGIAGFGVYEGAWTLVFRLLGYSERIAVLTSISHHLLTQVYGYSLGAPGPADSACCRSSSGRRGQSLPESRSPAGCSGCSLPGWSPLSCPVFFSFSPARARACSLRPGSRKKSHCVPRFGRAGVWGKSPGKSGLSAA